jgi:hypothetical protein
VRRGVFTCVHELVTAIDEYVAHHKVDNSGFVGWLASHLKAAIGTGVLVVCGKTLNAEASLTIGALRCQ